MVGFQHRNVQKRFIEQASQPGVIVLEAPMPRCMPLTECWSPKTSHGYLFCLAIATGVRQVETFLNQNLTINRLHQQPLLLLGTAWLKSEPGKECDSGGIRFQASKRAILATFSVSTIILIRVNLDDSMRLGLT